MVQGIAPFLQLHQKVETYASATFIMLLASLSVMWKKKNVGGEFVAAVLPHSCENACRHRLPHSSQKRPSALVNLPWLISVRMQGPRL